MMIWRPAECENLAPPDQVKAVLEDAVQRFPDAPIPWVKLGNLRLDRYDFAGASDAFAEALARDPAQLRTRSQLARCLNGLGRFSEALAVIGDGSFDVERGAALAGLGRSAEAEQALRQSLEGYPGQERALSLLADLLRRSGRMGELADLCERLNAAGVAHSHLLLEWGRALGHLGDLDRARALLFQPARLRLSTLSPPAGDATPEAFNAALAEEVLTSPHILASFKGSDVAARGSRRVLNLLNGRNPSIMRTLLRAIEAAVSGFVAEPIGDFDPWVRARPPAGFLRAWALIQRGAAHEGWHTHGGGWLSGVYYIQVPTGLSTAGSGAGCIEFGPPPSLADAAPEVCAPWRHAPSAGEILLAPSHFVHRTIPTGLDEDRISFAFDVVPTSVA